MNGDIFREILKYVDTSVGHKRIDSLLTNPNNMKRKVDFISKVLEKKLSLRPSLEDLREKNIIKEKMDLKIIQEQIDRVLQSGGCPYNCVAPSISKIVKKMDFEYKKILIIHKLGIKRT